MKRNQLMWGKRHVFDDVLCYRLTVDYGPSLEVGEGFWRKRLGWDSNPGADHEKRVEALRTSEISRIALEDVLSGCDGSSITTTTIDRIKRSMDERPSRRYSTR